MGFPPEHSFIHTPESANMALIRWATTDEFNVTLILSEH